MHDAMVHNGDNMAGIEKPVTNYREAQAQLRLDEDHSEVEPKIIEAGLRDILAKRLIPIGRVLNSGRPYFLKFPKMTEVTYNVFACLGSMGSGKSSLIRLLIYFIKRLEPDCIMIIFDPMKMEFSKLSVKRDTPEKRQGLLNEVLHDENGNTIKVQIQPDKLEIFHIIPRFALNRLKWDQKELGYMSGWDNTTLSILEKDGGFIFAEDISRMSEEQIFSCLNYREIRIEQAVHYYLRAAMRICNNKFGAHNWYIQDLITVLRESVRKIRDSTEITEAEMAEFFDKDNGDDKKSLSSVELQLIEQLEKYKDSGYFVMNEEERKKYSIDWRQFIKLDRVLNISFLGFKKTDKIGEDFVQGQSDLILERLIEISNEYYDAVRKREQGLPTSDWENYLIKKWKVSLWFEESEIFLPRDCPQQNIKKWPCIKRLDYLMSFGRKFGFKNFGFVTQRIAKVHPLMFGETTHMFVSSIHGEERDQILTDFGVNKIKFPMYDNTGMQRVVAIRDVVTTLNKEKHQWIFIDKGDKKIAAIETYDSPVG
jgi:hypothetical protein